MNSSRRYSKEREARITFPIVCFCNCVRSPICSLSPFPVCTFSTDLERLPPPECFLQPLTVPSLRVFNRPGTLTPVRVLSVVCHCSRSARFWQTWNAHSLAVFLLSHVADASNGVRIISPVVHCHRMFPFCQHRLSAFDELFGIRESHAVKEKAAIAAQSRMRVKVIFFIICRVIR